MDWAKATTRREENHLILEFGRIYLRFVGDNTSYISFIVNATAYIWSITPSGIIKECCCPGLQTVSWSLLYVKYVQLFDIDCLTDTVFNVISGPQQGANHGDNHITLGKKKTVFYSVDMCEQKFFKEPMNTVSWTEAV